MSGVRHIINNNDKPIWTASSPSCGGVGMDLGPPVGVTGCYKCGQRDRDEAGHWVIGLDAEGRPVCKRHR